MPEPCLKWLCDCSAPLVAGRCSGEQCWRDAIRLVDGLIRYLLCHKLGRPTSADRKAGTTSPTRYGSVISPGHSLKNAFFYQSSCRRVAREASCRADDVLFLEHCKARFSEATVAESSRLASQYQHAEATGHGEQIGVVPFQKEGCCFA